MLLVGGAVRRDALVGLYAAEKPLPRPGAGARASRRRRAWPRLPPDARDQRLAARPSPKPSPGASRRRRRPGRRDGERCTAPISPGRRRRRPAPARCRWGRSWTIWKACCPTTPIMTNGAGNYATWIHRFHRFRRFGTQAAPTSGSMGYGMPAAVAAKELFPEREVVAFAGDGCFLMNGQEFATAVQYDLPIIVIVVNNGIYGTIRMHQEREYPGRVIATDLQEPGLRRARARLWRPWRDGGDDGRVRAGLRARAGQRQAGDHRDQARPRGDHPDQDADRDPRAAVNLWRRRVRWHWQRSMLMSPRFCEIRAKCQKPASRQSRSSFRAETRPRISPFSLMRWMLRWTAADYEVMVVDDGSTDDTGKALRADARAKAATPHPPRQVGRAECRSTLRRVRRTRRDYRDHGRRRPERSRISAEAGRGAAAAGPRVGIAAGQRLKRTDTQTEAASRRDTPTACAESILQRRNARFGCGLKAIHTELFRTLPYFDGWHRYLPALVIREGYGVVHVDVVDRARRHGKSNYGILDRGLRGTLDLIGVWWLRSRRKMVPD